MTSKRLNITKAAEVLGLSTVKVKSTVIKAMLQGNPCVLKTSKASYNIDPEGLKEFIANDNKEEIEQWLNKVQTISTRGVTFGGLATKRTTNVYAAQLAQVINDRH